MHACALRGTLRPCWTTPGSTKPCPAVCCAPSPYPIPPPTHTHTHLCSWTTCTPLWVWWSSVLGAACQPAAPSWAASPWGAWWRRWGPCAARTAGLVSSCSQEPWAWCGPWCSGVSPTREPAQQPSPAVPGSRSLLGNTDTAVQDATVQGAAVKEAAVQEAMAQQTAGNRAEVWFWHVSVQATP